MSRFSPTLDFGLQWNEHMRVAPAIVLSNERRSGADEAGALQDGERQAGTASVEKPEDIVGLYMAPPEHGSVLCCDEKSQAQALDRTQPGLPLKKGRAQTMTHDYKRHGTTPLLAALNVLDGKVIGQCQPRYTHAEWLKFLRKIDRETPKDKTLRLIADNYATHKHPAVQQWLAKHPRFNMHFTPTSASWLNRRIRRSSQQRSQAVHMDQEHTRHPAEGHYVAPIAA